MAGVALAISLVIGCDAAENVAVLPLPPLERPSREARLGLPEVAGTWHFAGWEVVEGDSVSLERTFPSFGALMLPVQRLDSIAGTFMLGERPAEIVGEVRRDGWVSLVTLTDGVPGAYLVGQYLRDTLWLELASILPPDEWPRDARAAFVRDTPTGPLAWLRGAGPRIEDVAVDTVPVIEGETPPVVPPPSAGPPTERTPTPARPPTPSVPQPQPQKPQPQQPQLQPPVPPQPAAEPEPPAAAEPTPRPQDPAPGITTPEVERRPPILLGEPIEPE